MPTDWSHPQLTDTFASWQNYEKNRDNDLAMGLDPATTGGPTNLPTNAIRWNSANSYWEIFNGTTWNPLASPYAINISGTVNKVTITPVATGATITMTDGKTLSVNNTLTFAGTDGTTITFQGTGTYISRTSADQGAGRLQNKDLDCGTVVFVDPADTTKKIAHQASGANGSTTLTLASIATAARTLTFPDATDQLVARATSDTLTNKTLQGAVYKPSAGNTVTLPDLTDTFCLIGATQTLTNKTLTTPVITSMNDGAGHTMSVPAATDTFVGRATTDTLTNKTLTNPAVTDQTLTYVASGTTAWDASQGSIATVTLTNTTTKIGNPSNLKKGTLILHIIQDGSGGRAVTWDTAYKWPGGTAPSISAGVNQHDVFAFVSDGTSMFGPPSPLKNVQ